MRQLAILALLLSSLGSSAGSETGEKAAVRPGKKHTTDEKINEKIDRYLDLLQTKKKAIEKFLKDNYSDFNHSDYTPEEYVSHPINAYMLMKRTTVIWQAAKKDILDPSSVDLYKEIQEDIQNFQKHQEL